MITFTYKGSYDRIEKYLKGLQTIDLNAVLNKYGDMGVAALSAATPRDTGETANSWYFTTIIKKGYYSIRWHNRNIEDDIPIVVLIQYGHGTRNGGWVEGTDYIMPAIRPVLDKIAEEAWREVTKI